MNNYCEPCKRHYKSIKPHLKTKKHDKNLIKHRQNNNPQNNPENIHENNHECSICLSDITVNNLHTTSCGHYFHKDCIQQWITIHNNCPNCRHTFPQIVQPIVPLVRRRPPQVVRPIFYLDIVHRNDRLINILLDTISLFERTNVDQDIIQDVRRRLEREL